MENLEQDYRANPEQDHYDLGMAILMILVITKKWMLLQEELINN